ncbi:MAG: leucine-rich repeat domain-containing protein [archaeon]|nr:leucine-rich repeat domain-containing protein [archaeon]
MDRTEIFHNIIEDRGPEVFYGWGRKLRQALEGSGLSDDEQVVLTVLCAEKKLVKRILSESDDVSVKPLIEELSRTTGADVSLIYDIRQALFHYGESPVAMDEGGEFSDGRFRYRVVSGRRLCAELLGPVGNVGSELRIPEHVSMNGKEHRVISIGPEAFMGNTVITLLEIPHWVEAIGDRAFKGCTSLSKADLNNLLRDVGAEAFSGTAVSEVVMQESLSRVGDNAFRGCSSLRKVVLSKKVKSIGDGAFSDCPALEGFEVSDKNGLYSSENGILYSRNKAKVYRVPATVSGDVDVPRSVTSIEPGAFEGCSGITSVNLHANLIDIGKNSFKDCVSLKSIDIPKSVETIGDSAFENCVSFTALNVPVTVKKVGRHAFKGCKGIVTVNMPGNAPLRGLAIFDGCTSMTRITVRKGVDMDKKDVPVNAKVKFAHEQ